MATGNVLHLLMQSYLAWAMALSPERRRCSMAETRLSEPLCYSVKACCINEFGLFPYFGEAVCDRFPNERDAWN
jgi:hypothetical protein